jgi:hypothetical protein
MDPIPAQNKEQDVVLGYDFYYTRRDSGDLQKLELASTAETKSRMLLAFLSLVSGSRVTICAAHRSRQILPGQFY